MALSRKTPPALVEAAPVTVAPQEAGLLQALEKRLKTKTVREAMHKMETRYGKERLFGVNRPMQKLEVVPTGFYDVDHDVLGRGGLPRGRIVEICGAESSGKTTFFLYALAKAQQLGLFPGFVDVEHAMDAEYAQACHVRTDLWVYGLPLSGEEAVQMAIDMLSGAFGTPCDFVVFDSTGAMKPKANLAKKIGEAPVVGARARLQENLINGVKPLLLKHRSILALISQVRANIGAGLYAKKTRATTSHELDHEFTCRIEVAGGARIVKNDRTIGRRIKFKTTKNKIGNPFQTCEIDMMYGQGLSPECTVLDAAVRYGIVEKSGSWFSYGGERVGQGREQVKEFLRQHPEAVSAIEARLAACRAAGAAPKGDTEVVSFDLDDIDGMET